jgi:hypothetical protein
LYFFGVSQNCGLMMTLQSPSRWAEHEFGFAQLGDKRRNRRLVKVAEQLAKNPGGTLPQAFGDWGELKAAYRLLAQRQVSHEAVLIPHIERTQQTCRTGGEYLIIEDTTDLDYSTHHAAEHLGCIGNGRGRGFELHTALAVQVEGWDRNQQPLGTLVGLMDQTCVRPRRVPKGESRAERLGRARKSQRWAQAWRKAGAAPQGSRWIFVADREADFYEPMQSCQQHGVDFIIRAYQKRRLANQTEHLADALAKAAVVGEGSVAIRARPGHPAREAKVQMRSAVVDLDGPWRPGGWQAPLCGLTVVEVKEINAPASVKEPLHWILLTSLCGTELIEVQRIIRRYTARWWIEEYHKALKSGCGVEDSQLAGADNLEALIAVLAVVAVRLLNAKFLDRARPLGFEARGHFGPEMLALLEAQLGVPKDGWTNHNVLTAIARLGGFLARKNDGSPGWQTIWRGWQRLMWMSHGVETLINRTNQCG